MRKIWVKVAVSGALLGLVVVIVMILFLLLSNNIIKRDALAIIDTEERNAFDLLIESQVETAVSMIDSLEILVDDGLLAKEQARLIAYHMVREARYDQEGYFWGDDPDGTNRILYGREDVENKNRIDLKDSQGTPFMKLIIKNGTTGGGFTDYWFPKKGQEEALPKRGYSLQSDFFGLVVGTGNYTDDIDASVLVYEEQLSSAIEAVFFRVLKIIIAVLAGVFAAAGFIGVMLARPLKHIVLSLEDISSGEGDLTRELVVGSRDETRKLADSFNRFIGKLAGIVRSVNGSLASARANRDKLVDASEDATASVKQISLNSDTILELAGDLNSHVTRVNEAFGSLSGEIVSLDKQIETQSTAVEESTAAIVEMTASINSVADRAELKKKSVADLLQTTVKGLDEAQEAKAYMDDLTASIQEILNITAMINDIADRTNLLSMNASIEAAHAGDAGKGFGVVAGEIRRLAESSSVNASSIEVTLKKNVELIKRLEKTTDNSSVIFGNVNETARETGEAFTEITHAMEELSQGAREINGAVVSLRDISSGVRQNSQTMNSQLDELHNSSRTLEETAEKTDRAVREIKHSIDQISGSFDDLNGSVKNIVGDVLEIEEQMGGFKV